MFTIDTSSSSRRPSCRFCSSVFCQSSRDRMPRSSRFSSSNRRSRFSSFSLDRQNGKYYHVIILIFYHHMLTRRQDTRTIFTERFEISVRIDGQLYTIYSLFYLCGQPTFNFLVEMALNNTYFCINGEVRDFPLPSHKQCLRYLAADSKTLALCICSTYR